MISIPCFVLWKLTVIQLNLQCTLLVIASQTYSALNRCTEYKNSQYLYHFLTLKWILYFCFNSQHCCAVCLHFYFDVISRCSLNSKRLRTNGIVKSKNWYPERKFGKRKERYNTSSFQITNKSFKRWRPIPIK